MRPLQLMLRHVNELNSLMINYRLTKGGKPPLENQGKRLGIVRCRHVVFLSCERLEAHQALQSVK